MALFSYELNKDATLQAYRIEVKIETRYKKVERTSAFTSIILCFFNQVFRFCVLLSSNNYLIDTLQVLTVAFYIYNLIICIHIFNEVN